MTMNQMRWVLVAVVSGEIAVTEAASTGHGFLHASAVVVAWVFISLITIAGLAVLASLMVGRAQARRAARRSQSSGIQVLGTFLSDSEDGDQR